MLTGAIVGFITWAIYLVVQLIVTHSRGSKLNPKRLLYRLAIAIAGGTIWGGILKYVVTGSPH